VKFAHEGDSAMGTVVAVQFVPDFVFGSTEQKRGRDGAALYLLRVDIETGEGVRALYVGGSGRHGSESVRDAVGAALRGAGRPRLSRADGSASSTWAPHRTAPEPASGRGTPRSTPRRRSPEHEEGTDMATERARTAATRSGWPTRCTRTPP
jgi:hypothetical protein